MPEQASAIFHHPPVVNFSKNPKSGLFQFINLPSFN